MTTSKLFFGCRNDQPEGNVQHRFAGEASATAALILAFLIGCFLMPPELRAADRVNSSTVVESLSVYPPQATLQYPSDHPRLIFQARMSDGSTRDVTQEVEWHPSEEEIVEFVDGRLVSQTDGETRLAARWQNVATEIAVQVLPYTSSRPLRFRNDILPILTRTGCNSGKCHGSASGKDGFRLSLYGFDPDGDYYRITREMSGRRINLARPDECLLVHKATGDVPHTGGMLIEPGDPNYQKLVVWLATGAKMDPPEMPLPVGIEVYPPKAVMQKPGQRQPMVVMAKYDDGSMRDVTDLAVFLSNNDSAATVSPAGLVESTGPGTSFIMARFDQFTAGTSVVVRSGQPYPGADFEPNNYIDELTLERWRDLHLLPSPVASDSVFLRRVYLDLTGKLPTEKQRESFLADSRANKRSLLVDELTSSDDFLDMWIMKLAEMLQIRRTNGLSAKGLSLYDAWLRGRVHAGVPINQIVRELIPASGSTFENPPTSYYQTETTPQLLAENIAQAFLGTRIQCAQCHNHPFDRWTMDDYYGFAAFVSQVGYKQAKDPREITVYNLGEGHLQHPVEGREVRPKFLGGPYASMEPAADYREVLAQWLTDPNNNAFANNIANILWAHFLGIGIVAPVDDARVSNPPSNPQLLDALRQKLVQYDFDVSKLAGDICKSKTYQLSTQTNSWNEWDDRDFSHGRIRRLRAEVLLDCISQVTATTDAFSGLPLGGRAIQIPNDDSNNYFLETFGRAERDTPCSCEVSTSPTLSQALHLLNGENTTGKIVEGQVIEKALADGAQPMEIAKNIYLTCLTRLPTEQESSAIEEKLNVSTNPSAELVDLFWAVLNSNEFIFNH